MNPKSPSAGEATQRREDLFRSLRERTSIRPRILLTGKHGQIGHELQRILADVTELKALGRQDLDLAEPESVRGAIRAFKPHLVLNAAAYTAPASGQWGTARRNSITGPSQFKFDTSLARSFHVRSTWDLDVRVDATNILNHATWTSWDTTVNGTTFGLPANANPMRSLQLTGRLRF